MLNEILNKEISLFDVYAFFIRQIKLISIVFLIVSGLFLLYDPAEKPETISLSTLASQINEGKIAKILVDEEYLEIEMQDGKKEKSVKDGFPTLAFIVLLLPGCTSNQPVDLIVDTVEPVFGAVKSKENLPMGFLFLS